MNILKRIRPSRIFASLASKGKVSWVNDKLAVKLIYKGQMGETLNLKDPKTFNEKMQWVKLYDRNPLYTELVDKHEVRKYVSEWIGEEYLIPEIGLWDYPEQISFDTLPDRFVLKCTHDSGSAVVCRDKSRLNSNAVVERLKKRMKRSHYWSGLEWPYKNAKPVIIAEQFMDSGNNEGLTDYKFYCFNGEPKFLYISTGLENHETAHISFFDLNGEFMPFGRADYPDFDQKPVMPSKLQEMISISQKCAEKIGADFVRIDLYQIGDQVYFSEFTFTPCGGYMKFVPEKYDRIVGDMLKLTKRENTQ